MKKIIILYLYQLVDKLLASLVADVSKDKKDAYEYVIIELKHIIAKINTL